MLVAPVVSHSFAQGLASTEGLAEVEVFMRHLAAGTNLDWAGGMVQEHLSTGGRRMRARLALAAAEALTVPRGCALPWAAAVELLHNATLAHDDIQDGDVLRRGEPTLWVRYGLGQAINAGDLMLMLPTVALEDLDVSDGTRWQLARALTRRAEATVRGQSQEMALLASNQLDRANYERAVQGKTGQLLALPVEGAALLAGRSPEAARALGDAFLDIGLLYQLHDDLADLCSTKGRTPGTDLREGRVSALVVAHLELHPNADWLLELLRRPASHVSRQDLDAAMTALRREGAVDRVLARIERLGMGIRTAPELLHEPGLAGLATDLADWIGARFSNHSAA